MSSDEPVSEQHGPAGEHYGALSPMPIEVIEAWGLGYGLGAAVKYIARHGRKPGVDAVEDLRKAMWFIQREIDRLERGSVREDDR
jgi:hypothetical protein